MAQGPGEMGTASCSLLWGGGYQAGKTSQPRCEVGQTRGLTEEASYWAGHSRGFRSLPGASGKSQTFLWAKLTLYCTQVPTRKMWSESGAAGKMESSMLPGAEAFSLSFQGHGGHRGV